MSLAGAVLVACACSEIDVGIIEHHGMRGQVSLSGERRVARLITVTVETFGGGCFSMDDTHVSVHGDIAEITPFDREGPGPNCTDNLQIFPHQAVIEFASPGQKVLRIQGRRVDAQRDELILLEETLAIEP